MIFAALRVIQVTRENMILCNKIQSKIYNLKTNI